MSWSSASWAARLVANPRRFAWRRPPPGTGRSTTNIHRPLAASLLMLPRTLTTASPGVSGASTFSTRCRVRPTGRPRQARREVRVPVIDRRRPDPSATSLPAPAGKATVRLRLRPLAVRHRIPPAHLHHAAGRDIGAGSSPDGPLLGCRGQSLGRELGAEAARSRWSILGRRGVDRLSRRRGPTARLLSA